MREGDEELRRLVQNLEKSIERAIGSSPQVEECLTRIRAQGYELALSLQATLAYAPIGELDPKGVDEAVGVPEENDADFRMSRLDKKFLRSLKIAVDVEEE